MSRGDECPFDLHPCYLFAKCGPTQASLAILTIIDTCCPNLAIIDPILDGSVGMGNGEDAKAGQRNMGWHPDLASQTSLPLKGGPAEDHIPFMVIITSHI